MQKNWFLTFFYNLSVLNQILELTKINKHFPLLKLKIGIKAYEEGAP